MAEAVDHKDVNTKIAMHPQDRADRTDKLRERLTGFKLDAQNQPSAALTDKCATILAKAVVRYIPWENAHLSNKRLWKCPRSKAYVWQKGG